MPPQAKQRGWSERRQRCDVGEMETVKVEWSFKATGCLRSVQARERKRESFSDFSSSLLSLDRCH